MIHFTAGKIWLLSLNFIVILFVSVQQVLAGPSANVLAAPLPQTPQPTATLTPTAVPLPDESPKPANQPLQLWLNHSPGNALVNTLLVEGDYVWAATNGDGAIRWNRHTNTFRQYNRANGLIHDKVRAIAIDEAGHKWFGTEGGVSKFDGRDWTSYTTASGLAHNKVLAIAPDATGGIWFGTWGGGLSYFDGQTWTTYERASGLASNYIHAIAIDQSQHVWLATPNGVNEFDGRRWHTYTAADGLGSDWVHAIAIDPAGHKWFGTTAGLSEFDGQTWRTYTPADGLVSNYIRAITIDRVGSKWIATAYGLSHFDGLGWTTYNHTNGLPHSHLTSIAFDPAGVAWLGTLDGVIEFDQGHTTRHTIGALAGNRVRAIAIDPAGYKWFATNQGVSKFDDHTWTTYTTTQGLVDNDVRAIALDPVAGQAWFGTAQGASEFDGKNWLNYTVSNGLVHPQVNAIAIDPAGHKWFGTAGGVSEFDGHTWRTYTTADGLVNDQVTAMVIDRAGAKWFGTANGGISRFDGQTWTSYTAAHGLPNGWVTGLTTDPSGQVWAIFTPGNQGGVRRFDGQTWIDEKGEGVGSHISWNFPLAVAIDQKNRRWLGVIDGLIELEEQASSYFTYEDGLASNRVSALVVEENGKVWAGTNGAGVSEMILPDEISPALSAPSAPSIPAAPPAVASTPTAPPAQAQDSPIPALLLQLPLVAPGHTLIDIQLDAAARRLYITDSNQQLHILDAKSYKRLATLSQVNEFILDAPHQRLYTSNEKELIVREAGSLAVLKTIAPPGRVLFNHDQHQVYIANRIYDAVTLKRVGLLPNTFVERGPGILGSDFNPARNEVYLAEGDPSGTNVVYSLDPDTLQITGDLLPEVSGWQVVNLHVNPRVFAERNLIIINSGLRVSGHGVGRDVSLRFMDATTLDEFTDWGSIPPIEEGCNDRLIFARPINGLIYRGEYSMSYESYYNLLVYDLDGNRVTWRDGLTLGRTNPNTNQMYLGNTVFDLATLSPVGKLPVSQANICVIDSPTGRIYAKYEGDLIVMAERGGQIKPPPPPESSGPPSTVPGNSYTFWVQLSPDYIHDHTLFIANSNALYRSRDNGQTWVRLRGGLPYELVIDPRNFTISPNFAVDQTLFVSGRWDLGIYRSTDGGDTWQPVWNGLTHLRVKSLLMSPNYASDETILAAARYFDIKKRQEGLSVFSSTNKGLSWTPVFTGYHFSEAEQIHQIMTGFLPSSPGLPSTRFRWLGYSTIERTTDNGRTWCPVTPTLEAKGGLHLVVSSPNFITDQTAYVMGERAVFRTTDEGDTWQPINLPVSASFMGVPLYFSPNFGSDSTSYLITHENIFRSRDGGQSWQVVTPSGETEFFGANLQFAPTFTTTHTLFLVERQNLFRSTNDGDTWEKITPPSTTPDVSSVTFHFSPNFSADRTLYLTSGPDLFRSTDGGDSWERWRYELTNPTQDSYTLAVKAISPMLADGTYRLFISSSYAGQFWALDPAEARWEAVAVR